MNPDKARNLLLTTDYPIDTVVGRISGSTFVPQATNMSESIFIDIPHGLGFAPLCIGTWSESSSFNTYYKFGSSPKFFNSNFQFWMDRIIANAESTPTHIRITMINWSSARNIYWRVSFLSPTNATDTPIPSATDRQDFYLNTDLNLMKVLTADRVSVSIPGSGSTTLTIPHNLGRVPIAMSWSEVDNRVRSTGNENAIGVTGVDTALRADNTNVYIDVDSFVYPSVIIHYRVYLD